MNLRRTTILAGAILIVASLIDLSVAAIPALRVLRSLQVGSVWSSVSFFLVGIGVLALREATDRARIVARACAIMLTLVAVGPAMIVTGPEQNLAFPAAFLAAAAAMSALTLTTYQRIGATFSAAISVAVGFVGLALLTVHLLGLERSEGELSAALRTAILFFLTGAGLLYTARAELHRHAVRRNTALLDPLLGLVTGTCLGLVVFSTLVIFGFLERGSQELSRLAEINRIHDVLRSTEVTFEELENSAEAELSPNHDSAFVPFSRVAKRTQDLLHKIRLLPLSSDERTASLDLIAHGNMELTQLQSAVALLRNGRPSAAAQALVNFRGTGTRALISNEISGLKVALQKEAEGTVRRQNQRRRAGLTVFGLAGVTMAALLGGIHWTVHRHGSARQRGEVALRRQNDSLRGFAHTVAHDLRAPLRGIAGYTAELASSAAKFDERGRHCLSQINAAAQNLERLIGDTLEYAKLDSETPKMSPVVLPTLVASLLHQRAPEIQRHGTQIDTHFGIVTVNSWERGLAQVIGNLLDNAIKYSRNAQPPRLRIETAQTPLAWRFVIYDNGVGFDMKYHDRIFGLFQRLVTQNEFEGTGAGLAIVRKITDRLGGSVSAESRVGGGATFLVELPLAVSAELV